MQISFVIFLFLSSFLNAEETNRDFSFALHDFIQEVDPKSLQDDIFDFAISSECEPLTTVANCVNVLSGNFFLVEKDLIGNTIEPLDLTRFYDSGSHAESSLGYGLGSQIFPFGFRFHNRN